jgi:cyclophilin family peptidyl-prolyl cis-trans isomerase
MKIGLFFIFVLSAALLLFGCIGTGGQSSLQNNSSANSSSLYSSAYSNNPVLEGENMSTKSNVSAASKNPTAVIVTNKGTFKAELFLDKAPISSNNFISLARSGFYNNLTFHRYVPGFVIQGGDPRGDGTGGSEKTIPLEIIPGLTHVKGALGMARTQDPNSATSQFYVALEDIHQLDDSYAVFGQVTEGMDVVSRLRQGDRMTNVTITE